MTTATTEYARWDMTPYFAEFDGPDYPESAFYMAGGIAEVLERSAKIKAQNAA